MVVNAKGQIVIPRELREKYGIYPGVVVEFEEDKGKIVLVKKGLQEKFRKLAGKYKFDFPEGVSSTDEYIDRVRGK